MGIEEKYERKIVNKKVLALLVLIGLAITGSIFAAFYAPTVNEPTSTGVGETGGPPVIGPANVSANESEKVEIGKIDSDHDGLSDWFEENYTHTDPKVANDRYALYLTTLEGNYSEDDIFRGAAGKFSYFMEKNKVPPENIIIDNATTFAEFKEYIDWLTEKSDENDFVYIYLPSHGSPGVRTHGSIEEPYMIFADEQGNEYGGETVPYQKIGEMLNQVKCNKMLVSVSSCALNASVEPLAEGTKYPRVVVAPARAPAIGSPLPVKKESLAYEDWYVGECTEEWQCNTTYVLAKDIYDREFRKGPYGKIGDEFLTVKSWFKGYEEIQVREWGPAEAEIIEMSDKHNISGEFYFGEVEIRDYYSVT